MPLIRTLSSATIKPLLNLKIIRSKMVSHSILNVLYRMNPPPPQSSVSVSVLMMELVAVLIQTTRSMVLSVPSSQSRICLFCLSINLPLLKTLLNSLTVITAKLWMSLLVQMLARRRSSIWSPASCSGSPSFWLLLLSFLLLSPSLTVVAAAAATLLRASSQWRLLLRREHWEIEKHKKDYFFDGGLNCKKYIVNEVSQR